MTNRSRTLTTHTEFKFQVRSVRPADEVELSQFFHRVTPDDRRFRFVSTLKPAGHDPLAAMIEVDHDRTGSFLAFETPDRSIIATEMLACDPMLDAGKVAISVRGDHKNRGISSELLRHVTDNTEPWAPSARNVLQAGRPGLGSSWNNKWLSVVDLSRPIYSGRCGKDPVACEDDQS